MCPLSFSGPERGYTVLKRFVKIDRYYYFLCDKENLCRIFVYSNDHKIT